MKYAAGSSPDPQVVETHFASRAAAALFECSFGSAIPILPRHFELHAGDGLAAGYVHFTQIDAGVYLCGGLCVNARLYKKYGYHQRTQLRNGETWSRRLLRESIELLGSKRAVFAYSGNPVSVRDVTTLGFLGSPHKFLYVQWHSISESSERMQVMAHAHAMGPF